MPHFSFVIIIYDHKDSVINDDCLGVITDILHEMDEPCDNQPRPLGHNSGLFHIKYVLDTFYNKYNS